MTGAHVSQPALLPQPAAGAPRVVVRRRLPDGSAGDVVGNVVSETPETLLVLPDDAPVVRIDRRDVIARRVTPPKAVRPSSSAGAIERIAAQGWPGTSAVRLGGWLLREGGGWTSRANSCLVAGDPGMPTARALDLVAAHYRSRALPPRLQLAHAAGRPGDAAAAEVEQAADDAGWQPHDPTHVMVADLRRLSASATPPQPAASDPSGVTVSGRDVTIEWAEDVTAEWAAIVRGGEVAADPRARAVLTSAPAHYLLLREAADDGDSPVQDDAGGVLAAGRLVRTGDWAGLSCIEVVPRSRRLGLGRTVSTLLLDRARRDGARFAYLQVEESNAIAESLYAALGFAHHHRYHYRCLR